LASRENTFHAKKRFEVVAAVCGRRIPPSAGLDRGLLLLGTTEKHTGFRRALKFHFLFAHLALTFAQTNGLETV
jgi:hypothetical protein